MKQYLLMIEETNLGIFKAMIPMVQFVEVESMGIEKNDKHLLLVTPMPAAPVPSMDVVEAPVEPVAPVVEAPQVEQQAPQE